MAVRAKPTRTDRTVDFEQEMPDESRDKRVMHRCMARLTCQALGRRIADKTSYVTRDLEADARVRSGRDETGTNVASRAGRSLVLDPLDLEESHPGTVAVHCSHLQQYLFQESQQAKSSSHCSHCGRRSRDNRHLYRDHARSRERACTVGHRHQDSPYDHRPLEPCS